MVVSVSVILVLIFHVSCLLCLFDSSFSSSLLVCLAVSLVILIKNQLLDSLIFFKDFLCLHLLQFCSYLISHLLLAFEWVYSYFSSSFHCDVRVSILDLSCFLLWAFCAINFPSKHCFTSVPEILVCSVFVLIGFKEILYFCLNFLIYLVVIQEQLFSFHIVVRFWVGFWILSSNLIALWSERLLWFQLFCICWGVLYFQLCGQF